MSGRNQQTPRAGALGAPPRAPLNPSAMPSAPGQVRRSAGPLPGLARTASALRQHAPNGPSSSSTPPSFSSSPILSLPAHLRNVTSAPRIPSPLGPKGTPGKSSQPKQSFSRTSKITQKHILLPEEPQTKPLPAGVASATQVDKKHTHRAPPRKTDDHSPSTSGFSSGQHLNNNPSSGNEDERTEAEKMNKSQRQEAGLPRLTAYATADTYRLKVLQAFLKREHGVGVVRVFDDAVYAVYTLPLLPGYGPETKVRSSPAVKSPGGVSLLERMTEAEEVGYHDGFFPLEAVTDENGNEVVAEGDGTRSNEYLLSSSPPSGQDQGDAVRDEGLPAQGLEYSLGSSPSQNEQNDGEERDNKGGASYAQIVTMRDDQHTVESTFPTTSTDSDISKETESVKSSNEDSETVKASSISDESIQIKDTGSHESHLAEQREAARFAQQQQQQMQRRRRRSSASAAKVAEVVFFEYGVTVFFGLTEQEERDVLEDCETAGCWGRSINEDDWEVEECHYVYDPDASYPRIYNDMFTFKSHSHLLKLSVSHAIAQSTKLSVYETVMQDSLASTLSFPKELAETGHLSLGRKEALKMTGRLFRLRMDVNLSSGILDTPELFWSEASLLPLYEAIRDYLEIGPRVQVLNDRLSISGDLLEIIHGYIDQGQMHRITWVVIGLIIIACLVALGEVTARIIFYKIGRHYNGSSTPEGLLVVNGLRTMLRR